MILSCLEDSMLSTIKRKYSFSSNLLSLPPRPVTSKTPSKDQDGFWVKRTYPNLWPSSQTQIAMRILTHPSSTNYCGVIGETQGNPSYVLWYRVPLHSHRALSHADLIMMFVTSEVSNYTVQYQCVWVSVCSTLSMCVFLLIVYSML